MDHYPEVNVSERECSRAHSPASLDSKHAPSKSLSTTTTTNNHLAPPQYTSFPDAPSTPKPRNDSVHSGTDTDTDMKDTTDTQDSSNTSGMSGDIKVEQLEAEYARYTDASPPYAEKAYEGKSEEESTKMRMGDYAKELSRMMGRQLVRGFKGGERERMEREKK